MALAEAGRRGAMFLALLLLLAGSAWAEPEEAAAPAEPTPYDDYDDLYFDEDFEEDDDDGDPFQGLNRGIFWLNDGLDQYILDPVATGLDYAVPDFAQRAVRNAFDNLRFPVVFFNNLFQLKPRRALEDIGRFTLNTTIGIGGLMDPASTLGLRKRNEDFGQTLGYWGVPPGPYLMLPFFGPSNVRDGCGLVVDTAFRAFGFFIPFWASLAMQAVDVLNRRALIRHEINAERRAALDWYAAVRSAYSQYRENLIQDRREGAETDYGFLPSFESDEEENP